MTARTPAPADLADPALYDQGIPQEVFAAVRAAPGLVWTPDTAATKGFWSVGRMADLMTVSRDAGTYSSELGHIQIYDIDEDVRRVRASMIDLDPPVHTRLRHLVSAAFTPRHVQGHAARSAPGYATCSIVWSTSARAIGSRASLARSRLG